MLKINEFVKNVLLEDIGRGDLFTPIAPKGYFQAKIIVKSNGVLSGVEYAQEVANLLNFNVDFFRVDGDFIKKGEEIAFLDGKSSSLLSGERTFLNLLQHSSGIATNTYEFKKKLKGFNIKLLDTRKTRPLLREFEKYSVRNGGGINHRFGLDDCLMLKDTHLKTILNLKEFIKKARKNIPFTSKIEVECESFEIAKEALEAGVEIIMCDNLSPKAIKEIVAFRDEHYPSILIEASGNINLETMISYAKSGVDAISSGSLIHQAKWLDFSMKIV